MPSLLLDPAWVAADLVVTRPKVFPADATVGDVRAELLDDHVHMSLIVDGPRLLGTLVPADLPDGAASEAPALAYAHLDGRTVPATRRATDVHRDLLRQGVRRAAVVLPDGTLVGLICLNKRLSGFCTDRDVEARAAERRARQHGRSGAR